MPLASVSLGTSVQQGSDAFFAYLPNIIGFLVILIVGYVIARLIKAAVVAVLNKLKVDEHLQRSSAGPMVEKVTPGGRPSRVVGGLVFWLVLLYALTAAIGALEIPSVTAFMNSVMTYLPNVIVAVLIFVVAAAISGAIASGVKRTMGGTATGKIIETVVPGLVMAIALFMVLTQLQIATAIVTITYAALIGMLALTGALAFGLGGREVAGQIWSSTYQKSQEASDQARVDLRQAREKAAQELPSARNSDNGENASIGSHARTGQGGSRRA